ncbi:MAG TPA: PHP domain-containing protein, partial [Candidatus Binatus sp.]|nr:PHP domain-containing protein [Candidatus Binatus sp.]
MNSDYIELRARSAFSFLEGASTPEDLAARAAELGYSAMALGDRDGLYGAPRFYLATKAAGIRQIVGAELTLDDDSRLYVLAPDRQRYKNLCRMITDAKMRVLNGGAVALDGSPVAPVYPAKGESRITLDELERHGRGLICLAGGVMSPLSRKLVRGNDPSDLLKRFVGIFGAGNLYVDLQRHLDAGEERLNRKLAGLADVARIPLVATNDVCHGGSDRKLLDVLTCIRLKTTLEEAGRALWVNSHRHLKSPAEMTALFRDLPGAVAATRAIAERCAF